MTAEEVIIILSSIISFISLLGALFIVITYFKFDSARRNFSYKLILCISISDLIFYVGKLLSILQLFGTNTPLTCTIQGAFINFGELASVLWTTTVAFTLYMTVIKNEPNVKELYDFKFHLFAYGIPFIFTLIPLLGGDFGQAGDFCWITIRRGKDLGFGLMLFEFYIPLWICIAFNAYTYIACILYLRQMDTNIDLSRLARYPLIMLICWIFPTIHRIYSFFVTSEEDEIILLLALHSIFESMQGILNAIVYGMNDNVKYEWKKYLREKGWCLCLFTTNDGVDLSGRMSLVDSDSLAGSFGKSSINSEPQEKRKSLMEFEMQMRKGLN